MLSDQIDRPSVLKVCDTPDSGYASFSPNVSNPTSECDAHQPDSIHTVVKALMIGPPDEKEEAKHDFIKNSHRPRQYKRWISEIVSMLSDFFWIFCHAQNPYKDFTKIDQQKMAAPMVPGGQTGGVEYEAMGYAVSLPLLAFSCIG